MKISAWLRDAVQVLLAMGGTILLIVLVAQVVFRYILQTPLFGIEEFARTIAVWLYFIAGAYALAIGGHISSDIRNILNLSDSTNLIIDLVILIVIVCASGLLTWYSANYTWWVYKSGDLSPGLWWPRYILTAAVPAGGISMMIIGCIQLIGSIRRICAQVRKIN